MSPLARWRGAAAAAMVAGAMLASGCATDPGVHESTAAPAVAAPVAPKAAAPETAPLRPFAQAAGTELGRSERIAVYVPAAGDTLAGIAGRLLGSADAGWLIAEFNGVDRPEAGAPLLVPLRPLNPLGVHPGQVQTVPILCYHRLGPGSSKMTVSPSNFEAQMNWLVSNGYQVIRLADLAEFLSGRRPLPRRSVVITFDDGYESVHRHAFPVLRRLGLPATVFVYTDFLGVGEALSFGQLQEMLASGLIDVQSHSKTHRNLIERRPGENDERYRASLDAEMRVPREVLERRLPPLKVRHLAYPFGDANDTVLESAARNGFELAATVVPGGNAFYAPPLLLRRTMIFGDMGLDAFRSRLQTSRPLSSP